VRIVVNADDFGYSEETVAATIASIEAGYVTSATIMAGAPAADQAAAYARRTPNVSFGVHLVFVGDGPERPLAPPSSVEALLDRSGSFKRTNRQRLAAILRWLPLSQIEDEIKAQVEWVRARGVDVSHVDSHRHLHKYERFQEALERALPALGLARVRNVQDVYLRAPVLSPTRWWGPRWRESLMGRFATTDHFYMPTTTGDTSWVKALDAIESGESLEVGVHPGADGWRAAEVRGSADLARSVVAHGASLVTWREL
jgi:predicted glycoside hydrolase/deacetylase ChbG (UPF0249 family)